MLPALLHYSPGDPGPAGACHSPLGPPSGPHLRKGQALCSGGHWEWRWLGVYTRVWSVCPAGSSLWGGRPRASRKTYRSPGGRGDLGAGFLGSSLQGVHQPIERGPEPARQFWEWQGPGLLHLPGAPSSPVRVMRTRVRLAPDCGQLLPGAQGPHSPHPPPQTQGSGCPEPGPGVASLPSPPCALVGQGRRGAAGLGDGAGSEAGARLAAGGAAEPPSRRGVDGVPGNGPALRTRAQRRWAPLEAQTRGPSGRAASTAPPPGRQQV